MPRPDRHERRLLTGLVYFNSKRFVLPDCFLHVSRYQVIRTSRGGTMAAPQKQMLHQPLQVHALCTLYRILDITTSLGL